MPELVPGSGITLTPDGAAIRAALPISGRFSIS
jgi:hypothetical protein